MLCSLLLGWVSWLWATPSGTQTVRRIRRELENRSVGLGRPAVQPGEMQAFQGAGPSEVQPGKGEVLRGRGFLGLRE